MSCHNRRQFLKHVAAGGVAAATLTMTNTKVSAGVRSANDRIRVAVVGVGGRGQSHLEAYCDMKDQVEIIYLVDPDSRLYEMRSKFVADRVGVAPKCIADLRKVLDDKNLDAISIASPNHWHSLQAIWGCQAGKDVYVEKPCSHTVWEGRKLVEAARKYDRIVQHGTQSRSDPNWIKEVAAVRSGKYGKLVAAYGYSSKPRRGLPDKQPGQPPKELDFDLWLGPAPLQPYSENLVPYNWHWFWDFGNGEIGNQGVHQMDIARWAMPDGAEPQSVVSLGGRFHWNDQGQTPNTQLTIIDFGGPKLFFENRNMVNNETAKVTNEFYLEDGLIKDGMFFAKGKADGEKLMEAPVGFPNSTLDHFRNFIECVRSRKRENLRAEVLEGHWTSRLCHLGNISYRLGRDVPWLDPTDIFDNNAMAYEAFGGMKQHLTDVANLKLAGTTFRLGRRLRFDAQVEKFVGDAEADALLTEAYRAPYVVPEDV